MRGVYNPHPGYVDVRFYEFNYAVVRIYNRFIFFVFLCVFLCFLWTHAHIQTPTMNGVPVEEHIRAVVKDLLRTRGIAKTGLVTDLHGSRKIPYKGMKNRLSLQVSAVLVVDEGMRLLIVV